MKHYIELRVLMYSDGIDQFKGLDKCGIKSSEIHGAIWNFIEKMEELFYDNKITKVCRMLEVLDIYIISTPLDYEALNKVTLEFNINTIKSIQDIKYIKSIFKL